MFTYCGLLSMSHATEVCFIQNKQNRIADMEIEPMYNGNEPLVEPLQLNLR